MNELFNHSFALDEDIHDRNGRRSLNPYKKENLTGIFNHLSISNSTEDMKYGDKSNNVNKLLEL